VEVIGMEWLNVGFVGNDAEEDIVKSEKSKGISIEERNSI
jgi:hypothetical protein